MEFPPDSGHAVPWRIRRDNERPRRNHTPGFKAKVALAAIKGDRTLTELAEQFDVYPNQITSWKAQLEGGAAEGVSCPPMTGAYRVHRIVEARGHPVRVVASREETDSRACQELREPPSLRAGVPAACLNPDSSLFLRGAACKNKMQVGGRDRFGEGF